ncbi:MAG: hypothetical protein G8345_21955, partial [Magnetococcales bacterium]|nr:hypothetical protein [Magnetococcales bacterium]
VDNVKSTLSSDAAIVVSSGSGTSGAYRVGDQVTVTIADSEILTPGNSDVAGITVNFTAVGGGSAVAMSRNGNGNGWTASYTLVDDATDIDATNRQLAVTLTDNAGNATTVTDTTQLTVDNVKPTVTIDNVTISGATGNLGSFRIDDTITVSWNNTGTGDNNSDIIDLVTVDFSTVGGGSTVSASKSSNTWTATYTITDNMAVGLDEVIRNIAMTVTDNAGNDVTVTNTTDVKVSLTNDAPEATAGNKLSYTENDGATAIDNTITIVDGDDTQITSAQVTISEGLTLGDVLEFTDTTNIKGSFSNGVLTLTGTDSVEQYQSALRSVTFRNAGDDPTDISDNRTITWQVTDANFDRVGAQSSTTVTSSITITPTNDVPQLDNPIPDQLWEKSDPHSFQFAANTFSDLDVSTNVFTYTAKLSNGDDLPDWLVFDGATRTFSTEKPDYLRRDFEIIVTATDSQEATVTATFVLTVDNPLPVVTPPAPPQPPAPQGNDMGGVDPLGGLPANQLPTTQGGTQLVTAVTTTNTNNDSGSLTGNNGPNNPVVNTNPTINSLIAPAPVVPVLLPAVAPPRAPEPPAATPTPPADNSPGANSSPSRTSEPPVATATPPSDNADGGNRTLTQAPANGGFQIVVLSASGGSASSTSALVLNNGIKDVAFKAESRIEMSVPVDAFAHTDPNAVIRLDAKLANGEPLPSWLSFDAATGKFEGTPPPGEEGVLAIRVQATDGQNQAVTIFSIKVGDKADQQQEKNKGEGNHSQLEELNIQPGDPWLTEFLRLAGKPTDKAITIQGLAVAKPGLLAQLKANNQANLMRQGQQAILQATRQSLQG